MICMFSSLNRLQPLRWYGEIPAITSLRCNHLLGSETEDPYGATLILHRELDRLAEAQVTLKPVVDAGSRDDGAALELLVFLLDGGASFERRAAIAGVLEEAARRDGGDEKGLTFDEPKSFVEFGAEVRHFIPLFGFRSEEHTSELQSLMRISYAVFCLKKKTY